MTATNAVLRVNGSSRLVDYLILLRPKGFVPAMLFVLTGYAMSPRARSGDSRTIGGDLALLFAAYAVGLSGGTLLLNSAIDNDDGPVNFLERPPAPPPHLAAVGVGLMAAGAALFYARSGTAGALAAAAAVLSCLYSHGLGMRRWKDVPYLDWLVNAIGYGVLSIGMGAFAGGAALSLEIALAAAAFSISIGGTMPASQLFQIDPKLAHAKTNILTALGPVAGLRFCAASLAVALPLATASMLWETSRRSGLGVTLTGLFVAAFLAAIAHVTLWARRPFVEPKRALSRLYGLVLGARLAFILAMWTSPL